MMNTSNMLYFRRAVNGRRSEWGTNERKSTGECQRLGRTVKWPIRPWWAHSGGALCGMLPFAWFCANKAP